MFEYLVVEFLGEDTVAVIHKSWLISESKCLWPSNYSHLRIVKAVKLGFEPEQSWKEYKIRLIKDTDNFDLANKYCDQAMDNTEVETESEDLNERRQIRPPQRYIEREEERSRMVVGATHVESENDENESPEVVSKAKKKKSVSLRKQLSLDQGSTCRAGRLAPRAPPTPTPPVQLRGAREPMTSSPRTLPFMPESPHTSTQRSSLDDKSLTVMLECRHLLRENNRLLQELLSRRLEAAPPDEQQSELVELLPLATRGDIEDVEEKLKKDSTLSAPLARYLGVAGGTCLKDCVGRIMSRLMSHEMALIHNWKGSGKKHGFGESPLIQVVFKAVRYNQVTKSETDSKIEERIKDWLRNAADRNGGRAKREKKKRKEMEQQGSQQNDTDSSE